MFNRPTPVRGDFGWAALAGGREVIPAEMLEARPYFGLHREAGYLWGSVRDSAGNLASLMRRFPEPGVQSTGTGHSLGGKLILQAAFGDDESLVLRKEARHAPDSTALTRQLIDGRAVWAGPGMKLSLGCTDLSYSEDGVIDVTGIRVAPGLHWYLPGRDSAIYYPTQTWEVEGSLLGERVTGFLFWEEAYLPPGGILYVNHDPLLGDELHLNWWSWATRWDDGVTEVGHFVVGHDRLGMAVFSDSLGQVRVADNVDILVSRNDDGYWADHVRWEIDGQAWELVPDPQGRMSGLGSVPNPQQEGLMRRVGETRTPVIWMAWGETVPAHGTSRRIRRPLHPMTFGAST